MGFLGCIVSGEGIEPDPEKVRAVVDWPVPRSVGEVRSFIGLCSYYRGFIKDLSVVAAPLFDLTRKDAAFKWTAEFQGAFNLLKERLVTAPVLAHPWTGAGMCWMLTRATSGLEVYCSNNKVTVSQRTITTT